MLKKWYGGVDWTDLANDKSRCHAPINAAMKLKVAYNAGNI